MLLSFLQRPVSWSCIRGSGLRQLCPRLELPVVLGSTLSSVLGELSSLIDGLLDGLVLGVEGDSLDDVVHLVPHLGSSEVVICRYWGLAGSSGNAVQLLPLPALIRLVAYTLATS